MCGDAGDPDDVAKLFKGKAPPDLVFTSPPYTKGQRVYDAPIDCWETLMRQVFSATPSHDATQILVNLGVLYRKGECQTYWDAWMQSMRDARWKWAGLYTWDKLNAMPGNHNGRLMSSFEFIFHLRKRSITLNKTAECRSHKSGKRHGGTPMKNARCGKPTWTCMGQIVSSHKVPDATIRMSPEKANKTAHPAVFPLKLANFMHITFSKKGGIIYDPFTGSGTSLLAANANGRTGYGMEISEEYCDMAVERFRKFKEKQGTPPPRAKE